METLQKSDMMKEWKIEMNFQWSGTDIVEMKKWYILC